MKLLRSNGLVLEVRDCGDVIFRMKRVECPLPCLDVILNDVEARVKLKELLASNLYAVEKT